MYEVIYEVYLVIYDQVCILGDIRCIYDQVCKLGDIRLSCKPPAAKEYLNIRCILGDIRCILGDIRCNLGGIRL